MNVQEAHFRDGGADNTSKKFVVDRGSFPQRAAAVAAAAAADAEMVDRDARFPQKAIDTARAQRLLGVQIPKSFGGEGASILDIADMCYALGRACSSTAMIFAMHQTKVACLVRHGAGSAKSFGGEGASILDIADMCYALGRACSSTAMIFAMHQTKVACLVRHGVGSAYHESLMRRVATEQMLLASSTTEGQNGGNIRFSSAAVEHAGAEISLVRNATVISYGAQADGIVTIARRANDAAGSDQVLLAITRDDYTLERSVEWETLGMRGTCSAGFELKFSGSSAQIPQAPIRCCLPLPRTTTRWNAASSGRRSACAEPAAPASS